MTTPTAIEAVAKAICCPNGCRYPGSYLCTSGELREHATAAIAACKAAIREPTWEMQIAGRSAIDDAGDFDFSTDDAAKIFRAMLDKAEG